MGREKEKYRSFAKELIYRTISLLKLIKCLVPKNSFPAVTILDLNYLLFFIYEGRNLPSPLPKTVSSVIFRTNIQNYSLLKTAIKPTTQTPNLCKVIDVIAC